MRTYDASAPGADTAWLGWERTGIERLLHQDLDHWQVGLCLSELLARRALQPGESFRFSLYRHRADRDGYERVGHWAGRRDGVTLHAERVVGAPPAEEVDGGRPIDPSCEIFLPLDTESAVLGFALFRTDSEGTLVELPAPELAFLSRVGGAALLRIADADRLRFAHRALASTNRYLEEAIELQSDALLAVDPEGRVVAANEAVESVLGVLPADLIGALVADALPNQTAVTLLAGAQMAASQSGIFHRLLRLTVPVRTDSDEAVASDGRPSGPEAGSELEARTVEASFVCVQLDLEAAPGILVSLRDVQRGEDEEWFRARECAGEALRGDALLRPVAALRGYLGLLRDELPMRGRTLDLLHTLDLQAEWLQVQLESQSLMENFRRRQARWRDRPVSPWVLVERALGRVRSRLEACGVRALRNLPDDLPWIRVDVEKWVVALAHLIEWTLHRTPGSGTLVIEEDPASRADTRLKLRLFLEPSPTGRQTDLESLGIPDREFPYGLSLAKAVAHHYGGTLICDTRPGRMPLVELTIPLDASEEWPRSA
ncbi:MAG: PAS domain-containing protein [Candidatus Eisenbacteria bacterium]|uniref:PAS domain-containing protein n=1 Tax=Eiseniibacteriota bacterium TaxID=2212470 RepID=A0A956LYY7_UNCEI|nr:PAS domain-containing protein [Candidatus Eisenbacteria bacterium]